MKEKLTEEEIKTLKAIVKEREEEKSQTQDFQKVVETDLEG